MFLCELAPSFTDEFLRTGHRSRLIGGETTLEKYKRLVLHQGPLKKMLELFLSQCRHSITEPNNSSRVDAMPDALGAYARCLAKYVLRYKQTQVGRGETGLNIRDGFYWRWATQLPPSIQTKILEKKTKHFEVVQGYEKLLSEYGTEPRTNKHRVQQVASAVGLKVPDSTTVD